LFLSKPILKHWACSLVICERFQRTKIYFSLEDISITMHNLEQSIGQQVCTWAFFRLQVPQGRVEKNFQTKLISSLVWESTYSSWSSKNNICLSAVNAVTTGVSPACPVSVFQETLAYSAMLHATVAPGELFHCAVWNSKKHWDWVSLF
jgi:hypothetical protein